MTSFLLFHYLFVYYPPFSQHFVVFNCQFSVFPLHPLTNIGKKKFSHFQKGPGTQVTYSFKICITQMFFSSLQKSAGTPYRRVPSQKALSISRNIIFINTTY